MNRFQDEHDQRRRREQGLRRLILARSDIQEAECAAAWALTSEEQSRHLRILTTAVIVAYARPFTQTRSGGIGPLPPIWSRFETPERKTIHGTLLRLRHEERAHSGGQPGNVVVRWPGRCSEGPGEPRRLLAWDVSYGELLPVGLERVRDHCGRLQHDLLEAIERELDRLYGSLSAEVPAEIVLGRGAETLREQPLAESPPRTSDLT